MKKCIVRISLILVCLVLLVSFTNKTDNNGWYAFSIESGEGERIAFLVEVKNDKIINNACLYGLDAYGEEDALNYVNYYLGYVLGETYNNVDLTKMELAIAVSNGAVSPSTELAAVQKSGYYHFPDYKNYICRLCYQEDNFCGFWVFLEEKKQIKQACKFYIEFDSFKTLEINCDSWSELKKSFVPADSKIIKTDAPFGEIKAKEKKYPNESRFNSKNLITLLNIDTNLLH